MVLGSNRVMLYGLFIDSHSDLDLVRTRLPSTSRPLHRPHAAWLCHMCAPATTLRSTMEDGPHMCATPRGTRRHRAIGFLRTAEQLCQNRLHCNRVMYKSRLNPTSTA